MQALRIVPSALFVDTYTTRQVTVQAEQWNDDSEASGISSLIGTVNVNLANHRLQVRTGDGWVSVLPHWWVSKEEDDEVTVWSDRAFRRFLEKKAE